MSPSSAVAADSERRRARALHAHRFLFRLAFSAGNIFAWIFVFRGFFISSGSLEAALAGVVALYALSQSIALFLTPLSGAALRHGIRRALVYGTFMAVFAFVCMSLLFVPSPTSGGVIFGLIGSFAILMGIHRALYWIPYQTADAQGSRGIGMGQEIAIACMPFIAGLCIETSVLGPDALIIAVVALILLSLFPLAMVRESYERFEWGFSESFATLFSPFNRGPLWLSIFDGIQGVTLLLIWPIAAFIILGQSFGALGLVLTITFCATILGRSAFRSILKFLHADRSTSVIALIAFSSWIFRLTPVSSIQIILTDVYYHAGISPRRFSIDAHVFDQSADGGHYVDEYTALKEMGMVLGRLVACASVIFFAIHTSAAIALGSAIILAGFAAAASVILSRRLAKRMY